MINVIAIDSIRTLPISAEFGLSLVFFYLVGALFFMIPSGIVSAELASLLPKTGGIYIWVREAFGKTTGFVVIWLNWIYNVFWYPTILVLVAGTFFFLFDPLLAENKLLVALFTIFVFWILTFANLRGMRTSSLISTGSAIIGTIFPMIAITICAIVWFIQGQPLAVSISFDAFFPNSASFENLGFFDNILFGLLGLEMSATHASEMRNPTRDYPRSVFITIAIVIVTTILASLAIAIVLPSENISLSTGVIQAFALFLKKFNLGFLIPVFALSIIIGGLGGVSSWIIGPTKGLLVASEDGSLPSFFTKLNARGVPSRILILQAILVSALCFVFTVMPTVNSAFWILSAITAQLAMIVYIFLFASVIVLRKLMANEPRAYRIPGGTFGLYFFSLSGITICSLAFFFGFIPTRNVQINSFYMFESLLIGGSILMIIIPIVIIKLMEIKRNGKQR
ncbi:amino acid permease [Candidatus Aerophobetes bacterium]|uniref:Amino acid permease n=1 Tax=Aerophobetes bacterium TaxID=2030807 RepID=A0A2A4X2Y7_UNCAE|nr:MAG: amino acid permease [Candidatus Aerophobetes bacterium]